MSTMKRGATVRCELKGCMGKPKQKDLLISANVEPYKHVEICKNCFCVHQYQPLPRNIVEDLQRDPNEEIVKPVIKKKKKKNQIHLDL